MRMARSSYRVSSLGSSRIIDSLNWCSTRSFWGSRYCAVRSASHLATLLTSLMLALPICCSGSCPGASFHSGSLPLRVQGQPDIGQLEQRPVSPGLGEQAGPAGLQIQDDVHPGRRGPAYPAAQGSHGGLVGVVAALARARLSDGGNDLKG